jgi:hypothetical protein
VPSRYLVRATDRSGAPVRREFLAESIAHAEQLAVEDGLKVRGISLAEDAPASMPPSPSASSPSSSRSANPADSAHGSEETLWEGTPSHWANLWIYAAGILIVTLPWVLWRWLSLRATRMTLTTQRLRIRTGVLSTHLDELELYRVRDSTLAQTFWQRIVSVGDVVLDTTDASSPRVVLQHLKDAAGVREILRGQVERVRRVQRVREIEMT